MLKDLYFEKEIERSVVLNFLTELRLTKITPEELQSCVDYYDWPEPVVESAPPELKSLSDETIGLCVLQAINEEYGGCTNAFLAELYSAVHGIRVRVKGEPAHRYACYCCGAKTLHEIPHVKCEDMPDGISGSYEICDYCNWEHDGTTDPKISGTPNRGSLEEYRERLKRTTGQITECRWEFESKS